MDKLTDIRLSFNDDHGSEAEVSTAAPQQDVAPDDGANEFTHPEDTLEIRGNVVSGGNPGGSRQEKRFGSSFDYRI